VVTYDQRGHGASAAAADYSLDALALKHPLLVGHSFGGLLAVEHAAARPGCAGVVAVGGGLKIERPPIGWAEVQAQLDRPVSRLLSRVVSAAGMGARLSLAELRRVAEEAAEREERLEEAYARLPCPVLVVLAGKADPVPMARRCWPRWTPPPPAFSSCIRRSSWHGCCVVTPSHSSGQRSWPTSLSASLKPRQLSCELPSWRGPALKAASGPRDSPHPVAHSAAQRSENAYLRTGAAYDG
jgi:pimeloyl-ACP methyl ester carboxylesterase